MDILLISFILVNIRVVLNECQINFLRNESFVKFHRLRELKILDDYDFIEKIKMFDIKGLSSISDQEIIILRCKNDGILTLMPELLFFSHLAVKCENKEIIFLETRRYFQNSENVVETERRIFRFANYLTCRGFIFLNNKKYNI